MISKILMCPCYKDKFLATGDDFIEQVFILSASVEGKILHASFSAKITRLV